MSAPDNTIVSPNIHYHSLCLAASSLQFGHLQTTDQSAAVITVEMNIIGVRLAENEGKVALLNVYQN